MFLPQFLSRFHNLPHNSWVNVHSIEVIGRTVTIKTTEEVEETSEKILSLKEDLEGEIQWRKELEKEVEDKTHEIGELERIVAKFDEGEISTKGLVTENETLKKQIADWRKNSLDLEAKIEKLQARKNKATVERDLKTGKLIAEFQGVKYNLEKNENG